MIVDFGLRFRSIDQPMPTAADPKWILKLIPGVKKSKTRVIVGIGFLVLYFGWIMLRLTESFPIKSYEWLFLSTFFLNGVVHLTGGLGIGPPAFLSDMSLLISSQEVRLKTGPFKRVQRFAWSEVRSLDYRMGKLHLTRATGQSETFDLAIFGYSDLQEIKKTLNLLAKEKGVEAQGLE